MFTSVSIERFKGIRQGELADLAQVNVLVGRNNSGKSTVLDALVLARSAIAWTDYLGKEGPTDILARRMVRGSYDYAELWYKRETGQTMRLVLSTDSHIRSPGLLSLGSRMAIDISYLGPGQINFNGQWKSQKGDAPFATAGGTDVRSVSSWSTFSEWKRQIDEDAPIFVAYIHLVDPHLLREPVVERIWDSIITPRKDKDLIQALNTIYGLDIEHLSFVPTRGQHRLMAVLPTYSVPLEWLGDGLKYAVVVLSVATLLDNTALLLEELESHQHPESLRLLVDALFVLAKKKRLQLFLTTHSTELISYALEAAEKHQLSSRVYHLSLSKDGILDARGISAPDAKVLADIGYDVRMHDKYLRVE